MVTDTDRGQLLLAGAVAIALALLGLTAIVNVVVFTETAGGRGTHEAVLESDQTVDAIERAAATVVAAADRQDGKRNVAITTLDEEFRTMTAERTGAHVELTDIDTVETGYRVTDRLPMSNDTVLNASLIEEIGRLHLTITGLDGSMTIRAGGESITISQEPGGFAIGECRVNNDTLHVEFARGIAWPGHCGIGRFAGAPDPRTVTLDGDASGSITVVYAGDRDAYTGSDSPDPDPVDWTVDVSYVYESDAVTREGTTEVRVYP